MFWGDFTYSLALSLKEIMKTKEQTTQTCQTSYKQIPTGHLNNRHSRLPLEESWHPHILQQHSLICCIWRNIHCFLVRVPDDHSPATSHSCFQRPPRCYLHYIWVMLGQCKFCWWTDAATPVIYYILALWRLKIWKSLKDYRCWVSRTGAIDLIACGSTAAWGLSTCWRYGSYREEKRWQCMWEMPLKSGQGW